MKKELFSTAVFTFFAVMAFLLIFRPFHIAILSTGGQWAYSMVCALVSTMAVCLSVFATWKWLKLSSKRYGYWGRFAICIMTTPQLIVGISALNAIAFDSTPYQLMDNAMGLTKNILLVTAIVIVFDYSLYRTKRNAEKRIRINKQVELYKSYIKNARRDQIVPITETLMVEADKIIYAHYDGYYTRVYYLDHNNELKSRAIPMGLEDYLKHVHGLIPTLVQCHKKYAINTSHMIEIKMNWFGILRIIVRNTDFKVPGNVEYAPKIE